jgi:hypothetical protein
MHEKRVVVPLADHREVFMLAETGEIKGLAVDEKRLRRRPRSFCHGDLSFTGESTLLGNAQR